MSVGLRIYITLAVFQPCRDLEAGDNQSLNSERQDRELLLGVDYYSYTESADLKIMSGSVFVKKIPDNLKKK